MSVETTPDSGSIAHRSHKWTIWVGRVLSAVPILILLRSAWLKLSAEPQVAQQVVETFGYPASTLTGIGLLEFACMLLYATPRTAVLGAVLLTGYLGGAVATHVRIGEPFVVPLVLGALIWAGLYLRDEDTRDLVRHKIAGLRVRVPRSN